MEKIEKHTVIRFQYGKIAKAPTAYDEEGNPVIEIYRNEIIPTGQMNYIDIGPEHPAYESLKRKYDEMTEPKKS